MNETTKKIIQMLDDDSFPSLVIIDDEWGTGKSHYIETGLLPELKKNNKHIIHFSLYGISTINEFIDKTIIEHYLNKEVNLNLLSSTANLITKITSKIFKPYGFIPKEVIKSYSAISREILYGKIRDTTIILDDLERVNDVKLINNILGKCLELTKKNIKIVIATNSKSLTIDKCYNKSFNNKVCLNISYESIVDISFPWLNGGIRDSTLETIKLLRIKNIRILKKASGLSEVAYNVMEENCNSKRMSEISSITLIRTINAIVVFTYLQYEHNYKLHDFIDMGDEDSIFTSDENIKKLNNHFFINENSVRRTIEISLEHELLEFIFDGNINSLIIHFSKKIEEEDPVDDLFQRLKSKRYISNDIIHHTSGYSLKCDINVLFSIIDRNVFQNKEIEIDEWLKNVMCFIFLLKYNFICHKKYSFNDELIKTLMQTSLKIKYHEQQEYYFGFNFIKDLIDPEIESSMEAICSNYLKSLYKSKYATSIKNILSNNEESLNELNTIYMETPILAQIGAKRLMSALQNWPIIKIDSFTNTLIDRYRNNDKSSKLTAEIHTLNQLNMLSIEYFKNKPNDLRCGMISILSNVIYNIPNMPIKNKSSRKW